MNRVSEYAFIHAKMHGLMAKSYLDERLKALLRFTNLIDLSKTLFPAQEIAVGDQELIRELQSKFEDRTVALLVKLLSLFPAPPPLLLQVLREYDYRNLKTLLRGRYTSAGGFHLWDIRPYGEVPLSSEGFPASLKNTRFQEYAADASNRELYRIEFDLDKRYYDELAELIRKLGSTDRRLVEPLIRSEITLQNLLWALRLRFYFNLPWEETQKLLFPLVYPEIISLSKTLYELPFDAPDQWANFKYGRLLGISRDGLIDPEGAEAAVWKHLYKKTRRVFYNHPFTLASVYAFFRIKQYEARLVKSVTEGIRMGIPPARLAELIGVA